MRTISLIGAILSILAILGITWCSDSIADSCLGTPAGCVSVTAPPCPTALVCAVATTPTAPPDTIRKCADGQTTYQYWKATPIPTYWFVCISKAGRGTCEDVSRICENLYGYQSLADCVAENPCQMLTVEFCHANDIFQMCPITDTPNPQ